MKLSSISLLYPGEAAIWHNHIYLVLESSGNKCNCKVLKIHPNGNISHFSRDEINIDFSGFSRFIGIITVINFPL